MNDITREQAGQITDLESYKAVTGAKRLKRTKEEMDIGLTPEEALERRLAIARGEQPTGAWLRKMADAEDAAGSVAAGGPLRASTSRKGDIVLRPAAKTDADYFENVPDEPVEVVLDQNWYSWFDTLMSGPFERDARKLMTFILNEGIGQVLTKFHFASDIEEFERPIRTPEQV